VTTHEDPSLAEASSLTPSESLSVTPSGSTPSQEPVVERSDRVESTGAPAGAGALVAKVHKRTLFERLEGFVSRLSTKNNFWHRVCSLIWLPFAFRSGIQMTSGNDTFTCVLPFRRFNRNWYNAMAGAALLGNAEIAGGMYIFKKAGKDYTVVCKELNYKFLRPCFGPAVYKVVENPELDQLIAEGGEFNITTTMNIFQPPATPNDREKRVGRCMATFHVTPKLHHKARKAEGRPTAVR
jgi:acyl-coenzyme A thioesterase PaaI-like protein